MGMKERLLSVFDPLGPVVAARNMIIPPFLPGVDNFWPYANMGGQLYPLDGLTLTMPGSREESIENSFTQYVGRAFKGNSIVFACMLTRLAIFSEARFQFRELRNGRPGDLFGTTALDILEHPFGPNSTTGDLLARMVTDVDVAGNFYATRRAAQRIRRMRPDWVTLVFGSDDPKINANDLDAEFLGVIYHPGGEYSPTGAPVFLQAREIAHWAPIPDPEANGRGMSWITPIVRDVMGDSAATSHKLRFFENAGTPQMVVKRPDAPSKDSFKLWKDMILEGSQGAANAYRTLFLTAGADATVVGRDLQQLDFKVTQGAGETRIAAAAGVHPVVVALSEGMQGSSLNAGNFNSARRLTADKTFRYLWRTAAGSLETLVPPPGRSQLWYDDRDVGFLREDMKDRAQIVQLQSTAVRTLTDGGYEPTSVVDAVVSYDLKRLVHTGKLSVQLQPPGEGDDEGSDNPDDESDDGGETNGD